MQNVYHSHGKQGQNKINKLEEMVRWYLLHNRYSFLARAMGLCINNADQNEILLLGTQ